MKFNKGSSVKSIPNKRGDINISNDYQRGENYILSNYLNKINFSLRPPPPPTINVFFSKQLLVAYYMYGHAIATGTVPK